MAKPQTTKPARKTAAKAQDWTPAELVFSIMAYLTTRKAPLIFSERHGAAPIAEIIGAVLDANGIKSSDRKYPKLIIPEGLEGITNVPNTINQATPEPKRLDNPGQILDEILQILRGYLDLNGQNQLLAALIREMKNDRSYRVKKIQKDSEEVSRELEGAYKISEDFAKILSGNL